MMSDLVHSNLAQAQEQQKETRSLEWETKY